MGTAPVGLKTPHGFLLAYLVLGEGHRSTNIALFSTQYQAVGVQNQLTHGSCLQGDDSLLGETRN